MVVGIKTANDFLVLWSDREPELGSNVNMEKVWCKSLDGLITSALIADEDLVFVRLPSAIAALNAHTGSMVWEFEITDDAWRVPPAYQDGKIVVVSEKLQSVVLLNAVTGQTLWSQAEPIAAGYTPTSISIGNKNIYITWHNYGLTAYDLSSGQQRWNQKLVNERVYVFAVADPEDKVYMSESQTLRALDKNGQWLWETVSNERAHSLVYYQNVLYFYQGNIFRAINVESGESLWEIPFSGRVPAVIVDGKVYAPGDDGTLISVNAETGDLIWSASLPTNATLQNASVHNKQIFVEALDSGHVYVLNAIDGQYIDNIKVAAQITEPNQELGLGPASNGHELFVPSGSILCAYH
jgi:outer membrane protein assembly factor BamB